VKQVHNASIIWKVVNSNFQLIGNWLIWKVGRGDKVQIGIDPWIGSKGQHRLPPWVTQGTSKQRVFFTKTDCELGEVYKLEQKWLT
jgi:hypothetical protein